MTAQEKEKLLELLLDAIDSSKIMNIQTTKTKIRFLVLINYSSAVKLKY